MVKKKIVLVMMAVFLAGFAAMNAEPVPNPDGATLNGYVLEESNKETIIGASVFIKGTKKGAYTNKSGYFSITGIEPGEHTVVISSVGYDKIEATIKLGKNQSLRETFELKQMAVMSEEVHVKATRELENRQITVSRINVPMKQLREIRIGGETDVFRTLQMLPGVLTSSQISSGLYIRGGSPDQNLVLLDGTTVYNPSHLFGFISTFNAEAIKDVELIKGGYPAEYGGRLSSVLNITQKDGNQEEFEGLATLGLISSKLSMQGPLFNGSWFIGGRRTYMDLLMPLLETEDDPIPDFGFYDINAKIMQNITENDKIFLSGFNSYDNFDYETGGMDMSMYMGNTTGSLRWNHIFGDNLFSSLIVSGSKYINGMNQDLSGFKMTISNSIQDYSAKANFEWFTSNDLTLKAGVEMTNYKFDWDRNLTGDDEDSEEGSAMDGGKMNMSVEDWIYSTYGQINYFFTEIFSLQAGLRANYWDFSDNLLFDPRIAFRWQINEDYAVKASYGWFHQYLRLASMENFSIFDTWLPTDYSVDPSKAVHYILSFETKPMDDYELNFDFYYKELENISELNNNTLEGGEIADVFFSGNGEAFGFEVFLQKKIGKLAGWIGYSFGFVNVQFDSINGGGWFNPKYDRRHDFKAVMQYEINEDWNVGGSFMFQSGQSYTGMTSVGKVLLPEQNEGNFIFTPSQRYGLRLPNSHQLNLNGSYKFKTFGLDSRVILDIYNVYSRRDILFRFYDVNEENEVYVDDVELLPIIPTLSFEIKF